MALQQSIFFDIHALFEREQIEFAYPTRKLWVSSQDKAPSTRRLSSMVQNADAVSAQTD